jgi:hypothetical protein
MDFNNGDLIVCNDGRSAEIVGIDEDNMLEVFFIVSNLRKANGKIFEYADDWETIEKSQVVKHVKKPSNKFDYPKCYKEIGFKPWDGVIFTRTDAAEDDEDLKTFQFPTNCIESESEDDEEDMSDFIVPDDQGEPFRQASPTNTFVIDMHSAVNEYNEWVPIDKKHIGVKRVIDTMEKKYSTMDDDRQFVLGKSIDYNHPPVKRVESDGSKSNETK